MSSAQIVSPSSSPSSTPLGPALPGSSINFSNLINYLGGQLSLSTDQVAHLHRFCQFIRDLRPCPYNPETLAARIYEIAFNLWAINTLDLKISTLTPPSSGQSMAPTAQAALLNDIALRLEDNFSLSQDQKKLVRRTTQRLIIQPSRLSYSGLATDGVRRVKQKYASQFANAFSTDSRTETTTAFFKRTASSVRNALRQDIRDSIGLGEEGTGPIHLSRFVVSVVLKYYGEPESSDKLNTKGYVMKLALMRRFALEHKELLQLDDDSNSDNDDTTRAGSKRKRGRGGRIPKGEDFWGRFDRFLHEKIQVFGKNILAEEWQRYFTETIAQDKERFPDKDDNDNTQDGIDLHPKLSFTAFGAPTASGAQAPVPSNSPDTRTPSTQLAPPSPSFSSAPGPSSLRTSSSSTFGSSSPFHTPSDDHFGSMYNGTSGESSTSSSLLFGSTYQQTSIQQGAHRPW
ncbi:hypothetical protein CC1G_10375 [Coprinopsis cinerea okayama7|uniref:Uncharacterized protein n=1 Tax=Coprinopsis cinerea (strain Okayama-7 / 130 / ATCC MYA-4618 / FGSC 9003) TaxID=240176 RepID=A8PEB0_COPC7|nr:hypothetical protein CC1G_10375 [Coprinopsis cinerea okayama7\|eukprot:XP_001840761.2 hypothetical protein CC1G_10375 [Coprinopsis cinerea okayama7\